MHAIIIISPLILLQYSTLSRNLKRVMMEYNRLETNHKEEMKELVKKQLRIGTEQIA